MICLDSIRSYDVRAWGRGQSTFRCCYDPRERVLAVEGRRVQLEATPCHLGGRRWWWLCPWCSRRCAVLYGRGLRCRRCINGYYAVEHEGKVDRLLRRARKARRRLGDDSLPGAFPQKGPKRMRIDTFMRLAWRALDAEKAAAAILVKDPSMKGPARPGELLAGAVFEKLVRREGYLLMRARRTGTVLR